MVNLSPAESCVSLLKSSLVVRLASNCKQLGHISP